MREIETSENEGKVWRLSVASLLLAAVLMVGLGVLGGFLAINFWMPQTPLAAGGDTTRLVSTTREVTISPNKAIAEVVAEVQRSVILLVSAGSEEALGTGIVVTSDGLIATPELAAGTEIEGIDNEGRKVSLSRVGRDALYGLEYLRINDAVLNPVDIRREPLSVGEEILMMTRVTLGARLKVQDWQLQEYALPPELDSPPGIQQWLKGNALTGTDTGMGILIDEEGKVTGLLSKPAAGLAIKAGDLEKSITRLAQGKREQNTFEDLGLTVRYTFTEAGPEGVRFAAEILTVTANSDAAKATLRKGDLITAVNGEALDFGGSLAETLQQPSPMTVTVNRDGQNTDTRLERQNQS